MFANGLLSLSSSCLYNVAVPPPGHFSFWTISVFSVQVDGASTNIIFLTCVGFLLNALKSLKYNPLCSLIFPFQYSCLENPMDGGAWKAVVHRVAKSWTRLSDFTFTFQFYALEKEMATHSSVLAWRIPGTGGPGGLPSMGSHRVGHDWSDLAAASLILESRCSEIMLFKVLKLFFFGLTGSICEAYLSTLRWILELKKILRWFLPLLFFKCAGFNLCS